MHAASNFKSMRGLDASMAVIVLEGVIAKEASIQEMIAECKGIKL